MRSVSEIGTAVGVSRRPGDRITHGVLLIFGLYLVAVSLLALISPDAFHDSLGPFGPLNEHYARDGAAFELAIGLGALAAIGRPAWQPPMLWVLAMQSGFHALNHLVDIQEADPEWVGYFDFVGLTLSTLVFVWALRRLRTREPR